MDTDEMQQPFRSDCVRACVLDPQGHSGPCVDKDGARFDTQSGARLKSYKVMCTDRIGDPLVSNALRFGTEAEARAYGRDLFMHWTAMKENWEVQESTDPVNARFVDGLQHLAIPEERALFDPARDDTRVQALDAWEASEAPGGPEA